MKPNLSMLLGAVALALITLLSSADSVHAQTFNPTISACLDDATTVDPNPFVPGDVEECDGDNTPGGISDFTVQFDVPAGDVQFRWVVAFIPPEWDITPGDDIPIGAIVGELKSLSTLGIIGAQCDSSLPVEFYMLNASIDPTDTVAFDDADDNGEKDAFEDKDNSGLQDSIEKYPEFIKRIIGDAKPIRRAAGIQVVADTDVLLQFLVFEPGTFLLQEIPDDESLGYPMITFLQDNGDPDREPEPEPITDFCSPLVSSSTSFAISKDNLCTGLDPETHPEERDKYGLDLCDRTSAPLELPEEEGISDPDEGGIELFHSPEAGTYDFTVNAIGQRDADQDTYENSFDTCPYDKNDGSPRVKGDGDLDEDGLDAACDPNDDPSTEGGINSDEDGDGYLNRGDNCPLIANGEEGTNQKDSDTNEQGDPRPDGIGDECDQHPDVPDGDATLVTQTSSVTIGEGGAGNGGGGGGGGATVIIIVVVVAAVVVVGGGAFFLVRRKST